MEKFLETNIVRETEYTNELLERNLGDMEGRPRQEMMSACPHLFTGSRLDLYAAPPGGEPFGEFRNRALSFLRRTGLDEEGLNGEVIKENRSILICSHNQFLKMLYFTIHKKDLNKEAWNALNFPFGEVKKI